MISVENHFYRLDVSGMLTSDIKVLYFFSSTYSRVASNCWPWLNAYLRCYIVLLVIYQKLWNYDQRLKRAVRCGIFSIPNDKWVRAYNCVRCEHSFNFAHNYALRLFDCQPALRGVVFGPLNGQISSPSSHIAELNKHSSHIWHYRLVVDRERGWIDASLC